MTVSSPAWPLFSWLRHPSAARFSIHFADDRGQWDSITYQQLAEMSLSIATELVEAGVRANDVVMLVLDTGPHFPASFFGALLAGSTPCPVVPPNRVSGGQYQQYLADLVAASLPTVILTEPRFRDLVVGSTSRLGSSHSVNVLEPTVGLHVPAEALSELPDIALLQFSSGSTGKPKPVPVTPSNLAFNVEATREWLGLAPGEAVGSWLPLHHDMGLVGMLMIPFLEPCDLWIMRPDQFIRAPSRWLELFGKRGAVITTAPNFGYEFVARRVTSSKLEGMDFSGWTRAIIGAEPVRLRTLERFQELLGPYGFDPSAFMPAYGLAEATLTVTGSPLGRGARLVRVGWDNVALNAKLDIIDSRLLSLHWTESDAGEWIASCGFPLRGTDVTIVNELGEQLPDGYLGELVIQGPSVSPRYVQEKQGRASFAAGALRTGDAGFVYEGEVFVLGRMGDAIQVGGRNVFAEELEDALSRLVRGRIAMSPVVVCGILAGSICVTLLVDERQLNSKSPDLESLCRRALSAVASIVGSGIAFQIVSASRAAIERTTSGKPRRRVIWTKMLENRFAGQTLFFAITSPPSRLRP